MVCWSCRAPQGCKGITSIALLICISKKLLVEVVAVAWGPHFGNHLKASITKLFVGECLKRRRRRRRRTTNPDLCLPQMIALTCFPRNPKYSSIKSVYLFSLVIKFHLLRKKSEVTEVNLSAETVNLPSELREVLYLLQGKWHTLLLLQSAGRGPDPGSLKLRWSGVEVGNQG